MSLGERGVSEGREGHEAQLTSAASPQDEAAFQNGEPEAEQLVPRPMGEEAPPSILAAETVAAVDGLQRVAARFGSGRVRLITDCRALNEAVLSAPRPDADSLLGLLRYSDTSAERVFCRNGIDLNDAFNQLRIQVDTSAISPRAQSEADSEPPALVD